LGYTFLGRKPCKHAGKIFLKIIAKLTLGIGIELELELELELEPALITLMSGLR
jgi:hypothetical protein